MVDVDCRAVAFPEDKLFVIVKENSYYIYHLFRRVHACRSAWKSSAPTGRIFMKFDILVFFENLLRKFKFLYNLTRITGTLHGDRWTFVIIILFNSS